MCNGLQRLPVIFLNNDSKGCVTPGVCVCDQVLRTSTGEFVVPTRSFPADHVNCRCLSGCLLFIFTSFDTSTSHPKRMFLRGDNHRHVYNNRLLMISVDPRSRSCSLDIPLRFVLDGFTACYSMYDDETHALAVFRFCTRSQMASALRRCCGSYSRVRWRDLFARAWPVSACTRGDRTKDFTGLHRHSISIGIAWSISMSLVLAGTSCMLHILCVLTTSSMLCSVCIAYATLARSSLSNPMNPTRSSPTAPNTIRKAEMGA